LYANAIDIFDQQIRVLELHLQIDNDKSHFTIRNPLESIHTLVAYLVLNLISRLLFPIVIDIVLNFPAN